MLASHWEDQTRIAALGIGIAPPHLDLLRTNAQTKASISSRFGNLYIASILTLKGFPENDGKLILGLNAVDFYGLDSAYLRTVADDIGPSASIFQ